MLESNTCPDPEAPSREIEEIDVIGQIRIAFSLPLPLVVGGLIGALVPIATYVVGHCELADAGWLSVPGAIVAGGCAFSALTVYRWGRRAFDSALKALGFVVLAEGVMSFSHVAWLGLVMLGMLVAINAIANGANLAVAYRGSRLGAKAAHAAAIAPDPPTPTPRPATVTAPAAPAPAPVDLVPACVGSSDSSGEAPPPSDAPKEKRLAVRRRPAKPTQPARSTRRARVTNAVLN